MNAALVERVKAHAVGCKVDVETYYFYGCPPGVVEATIKMVRETQPADFASTLAELARSKEDPKIAAAAVAIFRGEWTSLEIDSKRKNATAAAIEATLLAYKEPAPLGSGDRAARLAMPAAELATLGHSLDKLIATVEAHPTKAARDEAYRHMLTFGRLEAFPAIKAASERREHTAAAVDAVSYMHAPEDAEKSVVCPWARGFLGDADGAVAAAAGEDMVYCGGPYIDALLSEANKRLAAQQFKDPFADVMRKPCAPIGVDFMPPAAELLPPAADVAQCDRVYAFLEKAANDPKVDDAARGSALWNIYYQRRDDKTLQLMRKYEKSPNAQIAKRAKEAIKSLVETYKLKG